MDFTGRLLKLMGPETKLDKIEYLSQYLDFDFVKKKSALIILLVYYTKYKFLLK